MKTYNIIILSLLAALLIMGCSGVVATHVNADTKTFVSLSTSLYHNSMVIDSEGTLWGTGRNEYCELADALDSCSNNVTSYLKTNLKGARQVANGNFHTVVLMNDGSVLVAGNRTRGQLGISSGEENISKFTEPEFENGKPTSVVKVAAGHYGTYLLDSEGYLWGTGYYNNGQLTLKDAPQFNSFKDKFIKVPTPFGVKFKDITYGYDQVLAIDTDGNIWSTGGNRFGQLGIAADTNKDVYGFTKFNAPKKTTFISVSAGGAGAGNGTDGFNGKRHSLALDSDGYIWSTGDNYFGQLATGDYISRDKFTKIPKPAGVNKFIKISAGGSTSLALSDDGDVYVAGNNMDYALGISELASLNQFTKVPKPQSVKAFVDISSGARHSLLLDDKGRVWVAGANEYGQLGLGKKVGLNSVAKTFTNANDKTEMLKVEAVNNPKLVVNKKPDVELKIGFIGNSITFTNDIPERLREIAKANGHNIDVKYQAISGDTLKNQFLYRDWAAHRIVAYYRPDILFIQEQTSGTELEQIGWWKAFASSYNIEPIIYQAWYNTNGCLSSDTNADALGLRVAPVGYTFHKAIRGEWKCSDKKINNLTQQNAINADIIYTKPKDYHPTMRGSYLSALTLYATIYRVTDTKTIIKKPIVPNTKDITDAEWDEMKNLAIGALNNDKTSENILRATREYKSNAKIDYSSFVLSEIGTVKTFKFTPYSAQTIRFEVPANSEIEINLDTDDNGSFFWFMSESGGRLIGKSAPSMPWPSRENGSCLNANSIKFNNQYSCLENQSLAQLFFGYGDRIAGGIPYPNRKLPAGKYVFTLIEALGNSSEATVEFKLK